MIVGAKIKAGGTAALLQHGTPSFTGQVGVVWATILAAGPAGATAEALLKRVYPNGRRPASAKSAVSVALMRLRDAIKPHSYRVVKVDGAKPTRWAIVGPDVDVPSSPVEAALHTTAPPAAAASARSVAPAAAPFCEAVDLPEASRFLPSRADRGLPIAPFIGAAAAVNALRRNSCRWPIGDVGASDFRFCCAPAVAGSTMPYCAEHHARASDGIQRRSAA